MGGRFQASTSNLWLTFIGVLLFAFPFINDSRSLLIIMTQIFIFAAFAMSYDLLLGYTGIISFGHAMFFGIGAYTTAIFLQRIDHTLPVLFLALVVGLVIAGVVSFLVGVLSLRLKSHFYAMLTLAFSGLFLVAAEKWRSLTMGGEGFTFRIPEVLRDRTVLYFTALIFMVLMYLIMRRFTNSPTGKVLQAIRENEQRTESLGYNVLHYKVLASILSGMVASLSGAMYVLTLRFVNTSVLSVDVTLNALLMTIIGGVGTLVGGFIGAGLIEFAHLGLSDLAKVHWIFERWLIFFGLVFVLVVMFFPQGIVGTIQKWLFSWRVKKEDEAKKISANL